MEESQVMRYIKPVIRSALDTEGFFLSSVDPVSPPQEEYVQTRHKLFAGVDVAAIAREARKCHRG
jgi:hypothetical protein